MFVAFLLILKLRNSTTLVSILLYPRISPKPPPSPRYNANLNIFSETIHVLTQYTVYMRHNSHFIMSANIFIFKNTTLDYRDAILIILSADSGTVCRCAGAGFLCCDPELELTSI